MSFRKRNVALGASNVKAAPGASDPSSSLALGVRPSPLDGRPTTSTGTQTLDDLLGGHAGFPLGHSLLIEENGTTDFAGALLRFYAAQGIVHGHQIHVVGVAEPWGRALPGQASAATADQVVARETRLEPERMKIAWRYERFGEVGTGRQALQASPLPNRALPARSTAGISSSSSSSPLAVSTSTTTTKNSPLPSPFIHSFDLTKRLVPPPTSPPINYIPLLSTSNAPNPYTSILTSLNHSLATTTTSTSPTIHRLIIPTLLSPLLSPSSSTATTQPTYLLPFLHALRSLLRQHPTRLTAMLTLPLSLHPRSQGLTCWIEHLMDGVLELAPFPYSADAESSFGTGGGGAATTAGASGGSGGGSREEKAQGLLKVHRLPVRTEKGAGASGGGGEDLAFVLSRRRFVIRPFWLPPVDGDHDGPEAGGGGGGGEREGGSGAGAVMSKKEDIEF